MLGPFPLIRVCQLTGGCSEGGCGVHLLLCRFDRVLCGVVTPEQGLDGTETVHQCHRHEGQLLSLACGQRRLAPLQRRLPTLIRF